MNKGDLILPPMAYISEMKYEQSNKRFWVRFHVEDPVTKKFVTIEQKSFTFSDYIDGREEALFYATEWRDDKYKELTSQGKIHEYRPTCVIRQKMMKNNKSEKIGVHLIDNTFVRKGATGNYYNYWEYAWVAAWIIYKEQSDGTIKRLARRKQFACRKWGFDESYKLACEHRNKMEASLLEIEHVRLKYLYSTKPELRCKK